MSQSSRRVRPRASATRSNANTTTTKSSGPYDRDFQQNLIDGGIYPHAYEYPDGRRPAKPDNWQEINERLAQPRPSLSPSKFSEEAHDKFIRADAHAAKEKQVSEFVIPTIAGEVTDGKCAGGGIKLANLDHLTDGTLAPGNPDMYYGARPEQLDRRVRTELSGHIIPSTQDDLPIAPNFFLAAKGPDGSLAVAGRQACYDGALGARGMHSLQTYKQLEPVYDNRAYTVTSIYHGGTLKMYTSHPAQSTGPESRIEYCTTQLNTWGLTGNLDSFRQGATAFRNARDWAKEQRDKAIAQANEIANDTPEEALTTTTPDEPSLVSFTSGSPESIQEPSYTSQTVGQGSETSIDELAVDVNPPAKRRKRITARRVSRTRQSRSQS